MDIDAFEHNERAYLLHCTRIAALLRSPARDGQQNQR